MSTPPSLVAGLDPAKLAVRHWPTAELWRIYQARYGAAGFNASDGYSARFTPLRRPDDTIVPTLYAGSSLDVALMETVFHDTPTPSAGARVTLSRSKETRRAATFSATDLQLVDFSAVGLRKLGLSRTDVIDSMKPHYPATRALAQWAYVNAPKAHGISWTSRQDDSGQAVVLFGDRVPTNALRVATDDLPMVSGAVLEAIFTLAERLGALVLVEP